MKRLALITCTCLSISITLFPSTKEGKNTTPSRSPGVQTTAIQQYLQGDDFKLWLGYQSIIGFGAWGTSGPPPDGCGSGIGLDYPVGSCYEHL